VIIESGGRQRAQVQLIDIDVGIERAGQPAEVLIVGETIFSSSLSAGRSWSATVVVEGRVTAGQLGEEVAVDREQSPAPGAGLPADRQWST
jgi:hypothetical protein